MPIVDGDIEIRYSGGAANSDPNASLGGAKSSVEVTNNSDNNYFDDVSGAESSAGDIEYRGVYIHNAHGSLTMQNTKVYVSVDSLSDVDIALAGEGLNATMETIANESTAPSGETFSHPTTYAGGLDIGSIPSGQHYGLWLRRTIAAAQGAVSAYNFEITVEFDTAA